MIYRLVILPPNFLWLHNPFDDEIEKEYSRHRDRSGAVAYLNDLAHSRRKPFVDNREVRKPGAQSLISLPVNRQIHFEASFILQSEGVLVVSMARLIECIRRLAFEDELREKRSTRQSTNRVSRYSRTVPIFGWVARFQKITLLEQTRYGHSKNVEDLLVTTRFIGSRRLQNSSQAPAFTWRINTVCGDYASRSLLEGVKEVIETLKRPVIEVIQECTSEIRVVLACRLVMYSGEATFRAGENWHQWHELIQSEMTDAIAIRICTGNRYDGSLCYTVCATDNDRF